MRRMGRMSRMRLMSRMSHMGLMRHMGLMGSMRLMGLMGLMRLMGLMSHMRLMCLMGLLFPLSLSAQIKIGGNVYGGGNQAEVKGNTKVVMRAGEINLVFGGARMANVGGTTMVNIDGENATDDMIISAVYGGNDISGTIGQSGETTEVPGTDELQYVLRDAETKEGHPEKNYIDNTWKTFVTTSRSSKVVGLETVEDKWIIIGSLYGGGNGEYTYTDENGDYLTDEEGKYIVKSGDATIAHSSEPFVQPEIDKTYVEIKGGNIAHVYGGGNNVTVRENTTIDITNESDDCEKFIAAYATAHSMTTLEVIGKLQGMAKLNTFQSNLTSFAFNHARVFGGNNLAEMSIRPVWNLQKGTIRDLYSGGNRGRMTSPEGLLLELDPLPANKEKLNVVNVYGGCRMADVCPTVDGKYTPTTNLPGYSFPNELSARTLIRGGHIDNVYGGNDITGDVYGGNAIGIYTTIYGNVYGGGNGAYAYTDNEALANSFYYSDFYYSTDGYASSAEALRAHRPNAEQVSIRLKGKGPLEDVTTIMGSVFVGGNSASLATKKKNPLVELKIGSHVVADNVFLGNNGAQMVDEDILKLYNGKVNNTGSYTEGEGSEYSSFDLTDKSLFAGYMDGVSMSLLPNIVFDAVANGDPQDYVPYSSYVGSFYCGGNVGSMTVPGKNTYRVTQGLNIYKKFVGGCNAAYVPSSAYNASYDGGILGNAEEQEDYTDGEGNIKDRLEINMENLTITPMRWDESLGKLIWNTQNWSDSEDDYVPVANDAVDEDTRLLDGNVYGGCYESGHVNGNVVINLNEDLLKRDEVFGTGTSTLYAREKSGVSFLDQRDDLGSVALIVFGGGYGELSEVWGSTTVNLNKGYTFQICGGGEKGIVGKKEFGPDGEPLVDGEGNFIYEFNPAYSSTVNLNGTVTVNSNDEVVEGLAETEYIYGGGKEGMVCGNTYVNLGNGRIYDAFAGACEADILGHAEAYIGQQPNGAGGYKTGIPWIQDIVYGGNDFSGTIYGEYEDGYDFTKRVKDYDAAKAAQLHGNPTNENPGVLKSSSYIEYLVGHVDSIYGGGYGFYDYETEYAGSTRPYLESSFVNIRPKTHDRNFIRYIFGGGTGFPNDRKGDKSQDRSYVLIDIPEETDKFKTTTVFGSGSYNGLGMRFTKDETFDAGFDLDRASAIVDLLHGEISSAHGGGYNEGITRRSVVNVPEGSTIKVENIFGGAYGTQILPPCDVYESNVNYATHDSNARVSGSIYGGNDNERRTLYTHVNISAPVWQDYSKGWTATVFGAGRGVDTWAEYTEVNLYDGAKVNYVYGGGELGHVLNAESIQKYMQLYKDQPSAQISTQDPFWSNNDNWNLDGEGNKVDLKAGMAGNWTSDWNNAWTLGDYYAPVPDTGDEDGDGNTTEYLYTNYAANAATNLSRVAERPELDDKTAAHLHGKKYNTNVIIHEGANVANYAFAGGLGDEEIRLSGDTYGTTYIALLGGIVNKDVYAGGRAGGLDNLFGADNEIAFTANANAYIEGGMTRNVYGGGYLGHVGHHVGDITEDFSGDRLAEAHVVIGKSGASSFTDGKPAITRNVYGGGEGGSVYGTSSVTLNNGMIGYRYKNTGTELAPVYTYVEELDDQKPNDIEMAGNIFGGGYVVNSYVDAATLNIYGGTVRGSLYGGGEIGPVGRGTMKSGATGGLKNGDATIYKAGKTQINMYGGHILRNVFGGGRGKDSWGGDGTKYMSDAALASSDLKSKGFVFGQTEVNILGGEVGTEEGMAKDYGNVFGGGDEGSVYSAYQNESGVLCIGKKSGKRYNKGLTESSPDYNYQGYYYKYEDGEYATIEVEAGTYTEEEATAYNTAHASDPGFVAVAAGDTKYKTERQFTEDCKVLVEPHCLATDRVTIDEHSYLAGEYVPTAALDKLKDKNTASEQWGKLDDFGIIIHNAVFAGGNIATGSSSMYANETTVFGNATATIHDAYNRDLITIGTGHTGGLYGDGNLTFVDGYRELNITNYGTDFYHIQHELPYEDYELLPAREQAYYEVKYRCETQCTDNENTTYKVGSTLPMDELLVLFEGTDKLITVDGKKVPNPTYWKENGVVSTYAGRIMNTIQRSDFCGVFGSRMVMKGAQDRVPETADYTNYTINRVREVSLNKIESEAGDTGENAAHGNYFGIYSIVNYLGALTSDVDFYDTVRKTSANTTANPKLAEDGKTFAQWKDFHIGDRMRNNGTCHNHVALASGVYLELTTEESTGDGLWEKAWGPITGVIELDLINVQPGIGGGFVYAKNQHGVRTPSYNKTTTLTALNVNAVTQWDFNYSTTEDESNQMKWETSGNFIHSSQTIIDDCYNISNRYMGVGKMPAHYWYISGQVYVYDQYISAYTGSPNAYSETVEIPLTIAAASHGKMTLLNVQPSLYAYYSTYNTGTGKGVKLGNSQKLVINDVNYNLNTPISYWDWYMLPSSEQKLFVGETYVTTSACKIGDTFFPADSVMLPNEYSTLRRSAPLKDLTPSDGEDNYVRAVVKMIEDGDGNYVPAKDKDDNDIYVAFDDVFHASNNISHEDGYILTYNVTNPGIWGTWYTKTDGSEPKDQIGGTGYEDGPTYTPMEGKSGLYGQRDFTEGNIISKDDYDKYNGFDANSNGDYTDVAAGDVYGLKQMYPAITSRDDQAVFVQAHILTKEYTSGSLHYYPGAPVASAISGFTAPAYISTATIQLSPTEYIYINDLMTEADKNKLKTDYPTLASEIEKCVVPAYYCTTAGLYGGSYYKSGQNYRGLEVWSTLSETDRENFTFNYDALDLLIDSEFSKREGVKYQYDSANGDKAGAEANKAHYTLPTPVDYTASYNSDSNMDLGEGHGITIKRGSSTLNDVTLIQKNDTLSREVYESLPNEKRHYAPITIKPDESSIYTIYVVKESFIHGEASYAVGATITSDTYNSLTSDEKTAFITTLSFSESELDTDGGGDPIETTFYYCRESYKVNEKGEGSGVTSIKGEGIGSYTTGEEVPVGAVIDATDYGTLPNRQQYFTIHGVSPMETSTLFVSRYADINDLTQEKVITVIYRYDYEESDESGAHITPVSERHVVNIHINFKSGVPTVEDIREPDLVLPGTSITMRVPTVTPGAYEIIGGGWELFEHTSDAESHINGTEYTPNTDSLYWYQDGFYLAYYAKTYLGKTYSNHVPISVANYHDLKKVMDDKKYHLHVDYDRTRLKRDSKIYINDYTSSSANGLDLLHDLYDLSLISTSGDGYTVNDGKITATAGGANGNLLNHALLNNSTLTGTNIYDLTTNVKGVKAAENLEFILRTDIYHGPTTAPNPSYDPEDPESPATITVNHPWATIGTDDICFKGNIHGDGHTISGLDNSLFYNLCGDVYNLGVTGSFTSAGVVDKGTGYVESCWTNTTGTPDDAAVYAVFGNPTAASGTKQMVNCYYQDTKTYNTTETGSHGIATPKAERAFYNGELAYDLNNFYLYKRYCDHEVSTGEENQKYTYFTIGEDGKLERQPEKYYADHINLCSSGYNGLKYVEDRFADGDFRFADASTNTENERQWTETITEGGINKLKTHFSPIWPDDYIFFGQKLTYGYAAEAHQNVPTAVARDGGRLSQNDDANRVYRAPAYFGNSTMGVAHFNPKAYLAQTQKDTPAKVAYPGMTAIDFKGHYTGIYADYGTYGLGNATGQFYTPLLDDDGLLGISNCDETLNLLVYAPASDANLKTYSVLSRYFKDPAYDDYYDNSNNYRLVNENEESVYGHLVQSNLVATNDHLLIDKQDFNCPIAYDFDTDYLMWYQRLPEDNEYVDIKDGWQGISLPFTAELVTTNQKGEITHFYNGSNESANGTGKKIGHEYWLRELEDGSTMTLKGSSAQRDTLTAIFNYPAAAGEDKFYTNTFLWDYYYQNERKHKQKDANDDVYLEYQTYYKEPHTFTNYSPLTKATPYILGLPGETYYEFDLSGKFEAENTATALTRLGKQTITFASEKATTIGVSDTELTGSKVTYDGYDYIFLPSYMNTSLAAGSNSYALDADGNSFDQVPATGDPTKVSAFRPYFIALPSSSPVKGKMPSSIVFGGDNSREFDEGPESALDGTIEIFARDRNIIVRSHMKEAATVRIVNVAGITLTDFVLEPGKTIVTPVQAHGTYIVNKKKIFVR